MGTIQRFKKYIAFAKKGQSLGYEVVAQGLFGDRWDTLDDKKKLQFKQQYDANYRNLDEMYLRKKNTVSAPVEDQNDDNILNNEIIEPTNIGLLTKVSEVYVPKPLIKKASTNRKYTYQRNKANKLFEDIDLNSPESVAAFQQQYNSQDDDSSNDIKVDGLLGPQTLKALNQSYNQKYELKDIAYKAPIRKQRKKPSLRRKSNTHSSLVKAMNAKYPGINLSDDEVRGLDSIQEMEESVFGNIWIGTNPSYAVRNRYISGILKNDMPRFIKTSGYYTEDEYWRVNSNGSTTKLQPVYKRNGVYYKWVDPHTNKSYYYNPRERKVYKDKK